MNGQDIYTCVKEPPSNQNVEHFGPSYNKNQEHIDAEFNTSTSGSSATTLPTWGRYCDITCVSKAILKSNPSHINASRSSSDQDKSSLSVKELEQMLIAASGPISGCDSDGKDYTSIQDFWNSELNRWYKNAKEFWDDPEKCPITDDGVLQGYGKLTPIDSKGSNAFLDKILKMYPTLQFDRVADCGAGVGRVTKNLLLARFNHVDLIEQSARLSAATAKYIDAKPEDAKRITCIVQGLQDFAPAPNTYDVIWIQWVIGYLHDLDTIRFFRRCAAGLKYNGLIVLKDNVSPPDYTFVVDKDDSSVARSPPYIKLLMQLADLKIVMENLQTDFPAETIPVMMYAIAPIGRAEA